MGALTALGALASGATRGLDYNLRASRQKALDEAAQAKAESDLLLRVNAQRITEERNRSWQDEKDAARKAREATEFDKPVTDMLKANPGTAPDLADVLGSGQDYVSAPDYSRNRVDTQPVEEPAPEAPVNPDAMDSVATEDGPVVALPESFDPSIPQGVPSRVDIRQNRQDALVAAAQRVAEGKGKAPPAQKAPPAAPAPKPMTEKQSFDADSTIDKKAKELAKTIDGNFGVRSQFSINQQKINAVDRLNALFRSRPRLDFDNNELSLVAKDIATIVGAGSGGGGTLEGEKRLTPQTFMADLAKVKQYVTNDPQDVRAKAFLQRMEKILQNEKVTATRINSETAANFVVANEFLIRRKPQLVRDIIARYPFASWFDKNFKVTVPEFTHERIDGGGTVPGPAGALAKPFNPYEQYKVVPGGR